MSEWDDLLKEIDTADNSENSPQGDEWDQLLKDAQGQSVQEKNSDIIQGLEAGTQHLSNLVKNQGAAYLYGVLNKITGDPEYQQQRDAYSKQYQDNAVEIEKAHPRNVASFHDAKTVGDYVDVMQRDVAEGLPMLLGLTPAAMLAPEAGMGALLMGAIPDTAIQTLQSDADLKASGVDATGAAFLMGAAKHGLSYLGKVQALQRLLGEGSEEAVTNTLASKIVSQLTGGRLSEAAANKVGNVLSGFVEEGSKFAPIGVAQAAIDMAGTALLADNKDFFTKENMGTLLEQGASGFLTGGLIGGLRAQIHGVPIDESPSTATDHNIQSVEQQQTEQNIKSKPFTDVGSASKYLTDRNLDPSIFSSDESLMAAANRLKTGELEQKDLSPALSTIYGEDANKPKSLQDLRTKAQVQPDEIQTFFEQRAQELKNQAILAQPEAQNLVARGLHPEEVVKLPPEKIGELSERINRSYDAITKPELDKILVDQSGNAMDQKTADKRADAIEKWKQDAKEEKLNKLVNNLSNLERQFMPGDGVMISPTHNDGFLAKVEEAQAKAQEKAQPESSPTEDQPKTFDQLKESQQPKTTTDKIGRFWEKYGQQSKKNHPIPESVKRETPITEEAKKDTTEKTNNAPELPLAPASKNSPEMDSRVINQETAKTQRNLEEDANTVEHKLQPMDKTEGQIHRSTVLPNLIFGNIRGTPPSYDFVGKAKEIADGIHRIAKEVGGPHVKVVLSNLLQEVHPDTAEPVAMLRGAQLRNMIAVAMEHINNPKLSLNETALHELWHMLYNDTNMFTAADKKLMDLEHGRIKNYVKSQFALPEGQLDLMSDTPTGKDEINATAFGLYANSLRSGKGLGELANSPVKRLFHKAINFFTKMGNFLRGAGFRTYEDLFSSVNRGEKAAYKSSDFLDNINNEMRQARLQKIGEEVQDNHNSNPEDKYAQANKEFMDAVGNEAFGGNEGKLGFVTDKAIGGFNKYFRTAIGMAHKYDSFRIPIDMYNKSMWKVRMYAQRYAALSELATKGYSKSDIMKVYKTMESLNSVGKKAEFSKDANGNETYDSMTYHQLNPETGKIEPVVSTDKRFNKMFAQTREVYKQVLNDMEIPIRNTLEAFGLDRNIKLDDLDNKVKIHKNDYADLLNQQEAAKNDMEAAKKKGNDALFNAAKKEHDKLSLQIRDKERLIGPLDDAARILRDIDGKRNVEYFPKVRFGSYGVSVYHKDDLERHPITGKLRPKEDAKAAYFGTVERAGIGEKRVNKFASLKGHKAHLSEIDNLGYLNNPDYTVFGKEKPFFINRNSIGNQLNSRMITLDLLMGLLNDKNMESYNDIARHLQETAKLKGFGRHMMESQDIPGYSKDWTRVSAKYLSGAAHFIGRKEAAPEFETYKALVDSHMQDPEMKQQLQSLLNYITSPSNDYLGLREINYLWALGVNPISALLQVMTLPTSSHMSMNTYNPNPIKNAMYLSKWFGKSLQLSKHLYSLGVEGIQHTDLTNRKVIDDLIARNFFDKNSTKNTDYGDFLHMMANEGRLEGFYKSDLASRSIRGSDEWQDKAYHMRKKVTNFMGSGLGFMETATRMATAMAHYDMIKSEKGVMERAHRNLTDDKVFQSMLKDSRFTPEQALALFGMDEAHAVFSKAARGSFQRGLGGVLMPFTQYPVQTLEFMARQWGRGPEAKIALALNLGMLFALSGALGLPGANILKDAVEAGYRGVSGHNLDLEEVLRERLQEQGYSPATGVMLTHGLSRPVLGMDLGRRIGFGDAIPTVDLLMKLFGIRGNSVLDSMGVQGSIIKNAGNAWNTYNNGGHATEVASQLAPQFLSNALQGYNYANYGIKTAKGNMLVPPDKVSLRTAILKGIGINPEQSADAHEGLYFTKMKENEWTDYLGHATKQLSSLRTQRIMAMQERDSAKAKDLLAQEQEALSVLRKWQKDTGYPLNYSNMNSNIKRQVKQNLAGGVDIKQVKKSARQSAKNIQKFTNTED